MTTRHESDDDIEVLFQTSKSNRKPPTLVSSNPIRNGTTDKKKLPTRANHDHLSIPIEKIMFFGHHSTDTRSSRQLIDVCPHNGTSSKNSSFLLSLKIDLKKGIEFSNQLDGDQINQQTWMSSPSVTNPKRQYPIPSFLPNSIVPEQLTKIIIAKRFKQFIVNQEIEILSNSQINHQIDEKPTSDRLIEYQIKIIYRKNPITIQKSEDDAKGIIVISSDEEDCPKKRKWSQWGNRPSPIITLDDDDDKENVKCWVKPKDSPVKSHPPQKNRTFEIVCNVKIPSSIELGVGQEALLSDGDEDYFDRLDKFVHQFLKDRKELFNDRHRPHRNPTPSSHTHSDHLEGRTREPSQVNRFQSSFSTPTHVPKVSNDVNITTKKSEPLSRFDNDVNVAVKKFPSDINQGSDFASQNINRNEEPNEGGKTKEDLGNRSTPNQSSSGKNQEPQPIEESSQKHQQGGGDDNDEPNPTNTQNLQQNTQQTILEKPPPIVDHPDQLVAFPEENNMECEEIHAMTEDHNTTPRTSPAPMIYPPPKNNPSEDVEMERPEEKEDQEVGSNAEIQADWSKQNDRRSTSYDSLCDEEREQVFGQTREESHAVSDHDILDAPLEATVEMSSNDGETLDFVKVANQEMESTTPPLGDEPTQCYGGFSFSYGQNQSSSLAVDPKTPVATSSNPIDLSALSLPKPTPKPDHEKDLTEENARRDFFETSGDFHNHLIELENSVLLDDEMMMQHNDTNGNDEMDRSLEKQKGKEVNHDAMEIDVDPNPELEGAPNHDILSNEIPLDHSETQKASSQPPLDTSNQPSRDKLVVTGQNSQPFINGPVTHNASSKEAEMATGDIPVPSGPPEEEEGTTPIDMPVSPGPIEEQADEPMDIPVVPGPSEEAVDSMDIPVVPEIYPDARDVVESMPVDQTEQEEEEPHQNVLPGLLSDIDSDPEDENYKPRNVQHADSGQSEDDGGWSTATSDMSMNNLVEHSDVESLSSLDGDDDAPDPESHAKHDKHKKGSKNRRNLNNLPTPSSMKSSMGAGAINNQLAMKNFYLEDYCQKAKRKNEKLTRKYLDLKSKINLCQGKDLNSKALRIFQKEKKMKMQLNKKNHAIHKYKAMLQKKDDKILECQINYRNEVNNLQERILEIKKNPGLLNHPVNLENKKLEKTIHVLLIIKQDQEEHILEIEKKNKLLESQVKKLETSLFPF